MDKFRGVLQIRHCNEQSRSEGDFAFLVTEDGTEWELCREGGLPFNDPYYEPYADKSVEITGRVSHGALIVDAIDECEPIPEPEKNEEQSEQPEDEA